VTLLSHYLFLFCPLLSIWPLLCFNKNSLVSTLNSLELSSLVFRRLCSINIDFCFCSTTISPFYNLLALSWSLLTPPSRLYLTNKPQLSLNCHLENLKPTLGSLLPYVPSNSLSNALRTHGNVPTLLLISHPLNLSETAVVISYYLLKRTSTLT